MSTSIRSIRRIGRRAGALAAVVLAAGLTGCGGHGGPPSESAPPTVVASPPAATPQTPTVSPDPLQASFTDLLATLPAGQVGVAVAGGDHQVTFGDWSVGPAWSTIKVPISVAALRADAAAAQPLVTRAITASDNDAAMALWQLLGDGDAAGRQVQAVLAEGDSPATVVQTRQVYPPYSPFGQTQWAQTDMARFAFGLPCLATADPVLARMRAIAAGQRWGLADDDTPSKGGWGPDPGGGYLVRQLAVLTTAAGTVGVALAAHPDDGSFDTGVAMLDTLGDWIRSHRDELPGGHCRPTPG